MFLKLLRDELGSAIQISVLDPYPVNIEVLILEIDGHGPGCECDRIREEGLPDIRREIGLHLHDSRLDGQVRVYHSVHHIEIGLDAVVEKDGDVVDEDQVSQRIGELPRLSGEHRSVHQRGNNADSHAHQQPWIFKRPRQEKPEQERDYEEDELTHRENKL